MMTCDGIARLLHRWQEGRGPGESEVRAALELSEIRAALEHCRECPSCRKACGALLPLMVRDVDEVEHAPETVSGSFEEAVMRRVQQVPPPSRAWIRRGRSVAGPRRAIAVAAILVVFLGVAGTLGLLLRGSFASDHITVTFLLDDPNARTVAVVGDFTGWQSGGYELSRRTTDGKWSITLRLRKDRSYAYCFLVDGERWMPDPSAPETVEDGFGGVDSILRL